MNPTKNEPVVVERVLPPLARLVCQTHRVRLSVEEKTLTCTRLVAVIVEGPARFESSTLAGDLGRDSSSTGSYNDGPLPLFFIIVGIHLLSIRRP